MSILKKLILFILFVILGLALILYGVVTVTAPASNPIDESPTEVTATDMLTKTASAAPLIGIGENLTMTALIMAKESPYAV